MSRHDAVDGYLAAWNARDGAAVVAALAPGATYEDPSSGGPISGDALAAYVGGLVGALPDLAFDEVSRFAAADAITVEWSMRGTFTGMLQGAFGTGAHGVLPGIDVFRFDDEDRITSVRGYFDQKQFVEGIGLQAIVQPVAIGPITFGRSVRMPTERDAMPGAVSITWLEPHDAAEADRIRDLTIPIMLEQAGNEAFYGFLALNSGGRSYTISAWRSPEDAEVALRGGAHAEAMRTMAAEKIGRSGITSIWTLHRDNGAFVRGDDGERRFVTGPRATPDAGPLGGPYIG